MAAGTIVAFSAGSLHAPHANAKSAEAASTQNLIFTLNGLALGGLVGLIGSGHRRRKLAEMPPGPGWQGWREFQVIRKRPESDEITSFELQPLDGEALPVFAPGQFLTLELPIPGQAKPVVRTYSLSDFPPAGQPIHHYRLSIKREPAPQGQNVPPGLASNFLHDHIGEGASLRVRPPAGNFVLNTSSSKPIVLISNGVGITPMVAMAKAAIAQPNQRRIWFVHGCRNAQFHAFRGEMAELAAKHPNLILHIAYSRPGDGDSGRYQSKGYVDGALLRALVDQDADYFLCGSPPFMQGLIGELKQAGIDETAIHFEMFSRAPAPTGGPTPTTLVTFATSGQSAPWTSSDPDATLLSFAEDQGLEPAFSCRAGVCGTCACRLIEGEVTYISEPSAPVASGSALICIAKPKGANLSLEL
jgi:ferredoxin-NADP reductase